MAHPTFTPPVAPSPGTEITPRVALNEASFGDGYSQASPKGLRPVRRIVGLRWDVLTFEQAREIEAFLAGRQGYLPFWYRVRGDALPSLWTCREWARTDDAPSTVRAVLVEWFGA